MDVVNLRIMGSGHGPSEGSIEEPFATLAELQRQGLIRHLALSNVTSAQVAQTRRIAPVVCVGGITPLQSATLSTVAGELGATPMQVALAWLLHRAPNLLLIPGTASLGHLHENLAAARIALSDAVLDRLNAIGDRAHLT